MNRAYSLLHVKAVDTEQRVISGTATTPEPDRTGDIVDPMGAKFKNPLPLLLFHDSTNPVGTVKLGRPTKDGIDFEARLPRISEPGPLKDAIDRAWGLVANKLVRGVSIGFRVLNDAMDFMADTNGIRFREIEILELSLVAIPANADATIQTIKSYDTLGPVARTGIDTQRPGVPGSPKTIMKNISEQLTAAKNTLATKSTRLTELHGMDNPSQADTDERDGLVTEVRDLTANVERLEVIERAQARNARPVITPEGAPRQPDQHGRVEVPPTDPAEKGLGFARAIICRMAGFINHESPIAIAKTRYAHRPEVERFLKAAVAGGTTTDGSDSGGWASPLVRADNLASEFIEFLRPRTIIGRFGQGGIPSLRRVPFNVRITGQDAGGSAYWVGQGKLKPVTKFDFNAVTLLWYKAAAISVISDELARFSSPSAETLVRDALAAAIIERLDIDFIDPDKAVSANVSPASITNGVTPITPTGSDADALRADLNTLIGQFISAKINLSSGVFIMPESVALAISLMRNGLGQAEFPGITMTGGTLLGFPVITSQYAVAGSPDNNLIVLAAAGDIFLADDGQVTVDISREASIEMSDNPENESGTVVSMFQSNQIALRAERYINWAKRRSSAVHYIGNAAYTPVGTT